MDADVLRESRIQKDIPSQDQVDGVVHVKCLAQKRRLHHNEKQNRTSCSRK
jgi:hypothetical protein